VGDTVLMLEYAVYTVCPPEACAAILWKDSTKADMAADAMGITVDELYKLRIIDKIVKEPFGGAHHNHEEMAATLKQEIIGALDELSRLSPEELVERRHEKFRRMGAFAESGQL
jgi:acetyl-CoA carboxylase carboxyl transferase subunit alpha